MKVVVNGDRKWAGRRRINVVCQEAMRGRDGRWKRPRGASMSFTIRLDDADAAITATSVSLHLRGYLIGLIKP